MDELTLLEFLQFIEISVSKESPESIMTSPDSVRRHLDMEAFQPGPQEGQQA